MLITFSILFLICVLYCWLRYLSMKAFINRGRRFAGSHGYVYFISLRGQSVPTVKVGLTNNYLQRLATHKTTAPHGIKVWLIIKVPNMFYVEKELHRRYKRYRFNGEWFLLVPQIFIDMVILILMSNVRKVRLDR